MNIQTNRRPSDLLEALEPRQLLASLFNFTDTDGDIVTVKLTGAGTVTQNNDNFELNNTDAGSKLTLSVRQQGGGDGRFSFVGALGTPGGGTAPLASLDARLVDFLATSTVDVRETKFVRVGTVSTGSVFNISTPTGGRVAINAVLGARGFIDADPLNPTTTAAFNVVGNVSSFIADNTLAGRVLAATGTVALIRTKTNLGGGFVALNYGNITAGGVLSARLAASTPDAKGFSFGTIRAIGGAADAGVGPGIQQPEGRIKAIIAPSWSVGGIRGTGIDLLRITGDFSPLVLNLQNAEAGSVAAPFAIKTGFIGGQWDTQTNAGQPQVFFNAPIGTLRIGSLGDNFGIDSIGSNVNVRNLAFTGNSPIVGEFEFNSIGTLSSRSALGGEWDLTGALNGFSIGTLRAPSLAAFDLEAPGAVRAITTNAIQSSNLEAAAIATLSVRRGTGGQGNIGESSFNLNTDLGNGDAVRTFFVAGVMSNSLLTTQAGNIDRFTAGNIDDVQVFVKLSGWPDFSSFAGFDSSGIIRRFTLTQRFADPGDAMVDSTVVAGTISNIAIAGSVDLTNGGTAYGFGAATFGKITMRSTTGSILKPVVNSVGDTNPFAPTASDFIFRVYAI